MRITNYGKKGQLKITYLHNSGIAIEKDELLIIIDYAMHTPGGRGEGLLAGVIPTDLIQKKSKVLVLVTHRHIDHYNKNILKWGDRFKNIIYVFSDDIKADKNVIFIS